MILTCPACGTQYVVKDGAIPESGRQVRCAACRHSWHQDPIPSDEPLELEVPIEPQAAEDSESFEPGNSAADEHAEPRGEYDYEPDMGPGDDYSEPGDAAEPAWGAPAAAVPEPVSYEPVAPAREEAAADVDDDFSPFADRGPVERRRRSPLVAILLIIVIVAALAAAFWFLAPPEWKAKVGLTAAGQTPLQLMMTHSDRQALASGNELLAVSGRVINPTRNPQPVPPIQAELRNSSGKIVYRWTIAPPTATLAPGASARFNSAEVNVPAGGEELTVSLGAPGA